MSAQREGILRANHLNKTISAGLILAIVFTALAHGAVEPWSVLVFELIVLAIIVFWAIKALADGRLSITIPQPGIPVALLIALGLAQSIAVTNSSGRWLSLSMNAGFTRASVTVLIFLFVSFIIASNFFASRERLSLLSSFLVFYGLAMAVFALAQHFTWNGSFYWLRPTRNTSPFGPFANHNHFAGYMEMLIPVPVALVITGAVRAEMRLLYGFAALMMGLSAVASLSRGGMISLAASMMFIVLVSARQPRARRRSHGRIAAPPRRVPRIVSHALIIMAIVAVIGAGIIWIGADPVINRVTQGQLIGNNPRTETFFATRGWVWRDTWTMIRANPILGVGLGAYATAFPIYSQSDGSLRVPQAHNDYLQVVADCGLVGGAIALWFIIVVFREVARGLKSSDPLLRGLALASGAGIFAILVHSIFDFNLQVPSNALLFLVLSAMASSVGAIVNAHGSLPLALRGESIRADQEATSLVRGA